MQMQQNANWVPGMTCLHRGLAPIDDIPSVTALHQDEDAAKFQLVLRMTCLHRGLAPMDDIPSVTALHQDEDAAKCQLGPGNDLPT